MQMTEFFKSKIYHKTKYVSFSAIIAFIMSRKTMSEIVMI